jgi:hypothetical protein
MACQAEHLHACNVHITCCIFAQGLAISHDNTLKEHGIQIKSLEGNTDNVYVMCSN